jgi:hypothetical protein
MSSFSDGCLCLGCCSPLLQVFRPWLVRLTSGTTDDTTLRRHNSADQPESCVGRGKMELVCMIDHHSSSNVHESCGVSLFTLT